MKALVIASLLHFPIAALASDCVGEKDDVAYTKASSVFLARITRAELVKGHNPAPMFYQETEFVRGSFEVVKVYKGSPLSVKFVDANTSVNASWLPLMVGQLYLIFAGRESSTAINTCTASRHFIEEREEQWIRQHGK
jgi:hypothetical protein